MAVDVTADQVQTLVLALLGEADKRYEQRFQAQQQALSKADDAVQRQQQAVARIHSLLMGFATGVALATIAAVLTVFGRMLVR